MDVGDRLPGLAVAEQPRRRAAAGWPAQSRSSSAPTNPEAPRMATSIIHGVYAILLHNYAIAGTKKRSGGEHRSAF